jgi:uncharacterized protein YndB with AHSA1/START domain
MVARKVADAPVNPTSMDLEGDRALVIARAFDAPARIVFEAWTRADLVRRWWAPRSHQVSVVSCEADVRVGGRFRYVMRKDGSRDDLAFSGEYREVTPWSRLVYTHVFEPAGGPPALVTVTFEERDGKTHLVAHELYPSAEVREAVLASGMEHGMRETLDQLEALVASLH